MNFYEEISSKPEKLETIVEAYDYFLSEAEKAREELLIKGSLEKNSAELPGIVEYRFNQLQEIEAILELLNIRLNKSKNQKFKEFIEHYNRALSSRDAEKYVDAEEDIAIMMEIINRIAFVRNKFLGIMKGLDNKSFQINNIVKLKTVGLDDSEINFYNKRR